MKIIEWLTLRLVICDRRSAHKSIWSGKSIICASCVPKIIICWTESTIIPWLLAPIETKQIDWLFKESNINHLPRRNRVLLRKKVYYISENNKEILPENFDKDLRGI